jgi:hypothetical protein
MAVDVQAVQHIEDLLSFFWGGKGRETRERELVSEGGREGGERQVKRRLCGTLKIC